MENKDFYKELFNKINQPEFKEEYWDDFESKLNKKKKKRAFFILSFLLIFIAFSFFGIVLFNKNKFSLNNEKTKEFKKENFNSTTDKSQIIENKMSNKNFIPLIKNLELNGVKNKIITNNKSTHNKTNYENSIKNSFKINQFSYKNKINNNKLENLVNLKTTENLLTNNNLDFELSNILTNKLKSVKIANLSNENINKVFVSFPKIKKRNSFFMDFALGINIVRKNLTLVDNKYDDYYQKRKEEEFITSSITPRITLSYLTNKGFKTSIGLEYFTYTERINYNPDFFRKVYFNDTFYKVDSNKVYNYPNKRIIWNYDTLTTIKNDSTINEIRNEDLLTDILKTRINYFEIPLKFGYHLKFKKFSLELLNGISIGILNFKTLKGKYISPEVKKLLSLKNETENFNKFNLNYSLNFRFNKMISRKWGVYLEPNYKANLNDVFNNKIIKQRYTTYGVFGGIYYKLN